MSENPDNRAPHVGWPVRQRHRLRSLLIMVSIAAIAFILLVPSFRHGRGDSDWVMEARTEGLVQGLCMALDAYRNRYDLFPRDRGIGLHPDLDKSSECLIYYLSGASIRYTSGVSSADYPWKHAILDESRLGHGRGARHIFYQFRDDMLADDDGDEIPELVDAWGRPLIYNAGPAENGPFNQRGAAKHDAGHFVLISAGADGKFGTEDDIKNWAD
jgi:hypothetical protein